MVGGRPGGHSLLAIPALCRRKTYKKLYQTRHATALLAYTLCVLVEKVSWSSPAHYQQKNLTTIGGLPVPADGDKYFGPGEVTDGVPKLFLYLGANIIPPQNGVFFLLKSVVTPLVDLSC